MNPLVYIDFNEQRLSLLRISKSGIENEKKPTIGYYPDPVIG
jgi:hypothetical protein